MVERGMGATETVGSVIRALPGYQASRRQAWRAASVRMSAIVHRFHQLVVEPGLCGLRRRAIRHGALMDVRDSETLHARCPLRAFAYIQSDATITGKPAGGIEYGFAADL